MTSEQPDIERSPAYLLLRLGDTARTILDTELAAWDLDTRLLRTLIAARAGNLSQQDLCAVTTMDRTTMVGLVDRLADKGLVQRNPHPSDRRKHVVAMTPSGLGTLEKVMQKLGQSEREFLAVLDSTQVTALTEALGKLYRAHDPTCQTDDNPA